MRLWIPAVVLLAAAIATGGCSSGGKRGCTFDTDCPGNQKCNQGSCTDNPCGSCPAGEFCDGVACVPCADSQHCGGGCVDCTALATDHACLSGQCGCNSASDCASGQQCQGNRCSGGVCTPDCSGIQCGPDPLCQKSCGNCPSTNASCAGSCNAGHCAYPGGEVGCGALSCTGSDLTDNRCNGAGDCRAVVTPCAPYRCGAGAACLTGCTSDSDCSPGNYCSAKNQCGPLLPPEVTIEANPACGTPPFLVSFTADNSGGPITSYHWKFGDGGTADTGPNVSHTYTVTGRFGAAVDVSGPGGSGTFTQGGLVRSLVPGWNVESPDPPCQTINATWPGAGAEPPWAVGDGGLVLRRQGLAWSRLDPGVTSNLNGVDGSAPGNIWIVGDSAVRQYDGTGFVDRSGGLPAGVSWKDIYAPNPANAWIVGTGGNIWKWNGSSWTQQASTVTDIIEGIGGNGVQVLVATVYTSNAEVLVTFNGGVNWYLFQDANITGAYLRDAVVATASPFVAYMVGNKRLLELDEYNWLLLDQWPDPNRFSYMWEISRDPSGSEVWATGYSENVVLRNVTGSWQFMPAPVTTGLLKGIAVVSAADVTVGGSAASLWHFDGVNWTGQASSIACSNFSSLWGEPGGKLFVAGDGGQVFTWDGQVWQGSPTGLTGSLYGIWGSAPNDVTAVGAGGGIAHFDGFAWKVQQAPVTADLRAVYGFGPADRYAVGDSGTLLHSPGGGAWLSEAPALQGAGGFQAVWGGAPDDVWAGGTGVLAHKVAGSWQVLLDQPQPFGQCCPDQSCPGCDTLSDFTGIAGTAIDDATAVGGQIQFGWLFVPIGMCPPPSQFVCLGISSQVLARHYNGQTWLDVPYVNTAANPVSVWAADRTHHLARDSSGMSLWDGSTWVAFPSALPADASDAHQVFGFDAGDFFIGGYGRLWHYQGCP